MHEGASDQADATGGDVTVRLTSDLRVGIEGNRARARHLLQEGEKRFVALSWSAVLDAPHSLDQAEAMLADTSHYWRYWLAAGNFPDHRLGAGCSARRSRSRGSRTRPPGRRWPP